MFLDMSVHISLVFEAFAAVRIGASMFMMITVSELVSLVLTLKWEILTTGFADKWTGFMLVLVLGQGQLIVEGLFANTTVHYSM